MTNCYSFRSHFTHIFPWSWLTVILLDHTSHSCPPRSLPTPISPHHICVELALIEPLLEPGLTQLCVLQVRSLLKRAHLGSILFYFQLTLGFNSKSNSRKQLLPPRISPRISAPISPRISAHIPSPIPPHIPTPISPQILLTYQLTFQLLFLLLFLLAYHLHFLLTFQLTFLLLFLLNSNSYFSSNSPRIVAPSQGWWLGLVSRADGSGWWLAFFSFPTSYENWGKDEETIAL